MVLAPEHPLVDELVPAGGWPEGTKDAWTGGAATPQEAVTAYRRAASRKNDVERQSEGKDKTGVFTGGWATNPVTGTRIPVFVADYVLMGYGTGAIMAVPGQDERDWDFAKAFDLPIIRTVQPTDDHDLDTAFTGEGPAINSAQRRAQPRRARRRRGQGADHRLARGEGPRRAHGHLQAARLAVQPAALLGRAVPGRLRRGRHRARRARLDAARRAARGARLQPEDLRPRRREQRARAAAVAGRRVGARRPRPRRRPRHPALPPRDQHDAQLGRVVLVLPALPRPGEQRRARRPRQRVVLDGAARRAGRRRPRGHPRPGRRRPLRRRRRARRAAPALRAVLAQGAARPGPPEQRRAVPHLLQPGLHPGRRLHATAAAQSVEATEVEEAADGSLHLARPAGHPRVRQDRQVAEEHGQPRRDVRRVRRRHLPALRDGPGPAGAEQAVGHPGRRRQPAVPAAAVAQRRRRGDRCGRRRRHPDG